MTDNFAPLIESDHWLKWDDPAQVVRDEIEQILQKQVATATLEWVHLVGKPEFLTGGRKLPNDPDKIIVTRAAFAVQFELQVRSEGREDRLRGVFSWVATGLEAERNDRVYLDLDAEMGWASEVLKARIYDLDAVADE